MEAESRLIISNTKLISNIINVFVLTGPGSIKIARDNYCMRMGGGFVIPSSFCQKHIYVMDIFYLLQGKMAAFTARHSNNDFDRCATFIADL
ncbi:uncharacterized protein CIMG_13161 [Coccidioides immitis RS]|uniref:Uncharacterized protein n=1 Tax=Coccidioides immitis (strain RS) TaxID=246410 RepID=J3K6C2_COCIM|nr:uncharacterized protein CIMG_13161 [Coccidioides immitis RS]EAS30104.3 hypothetical protein CIMG_13161 [Coccidioides immitis RS]